MPRLRFVALATRRRRRRPSRGIRSTRRDAARLDGVARRLHGEHARIPAGDEGGEYRLAERGGLLKRGGGRPIDHGARNFRRDCADDGRAGGGGTLGDARGHAITPGTVCRRGVNVAPRGGHPYGAPEGAGVHPISQPKNPI